MMISLLREDLFVALASTAKEMHMDTPTPISIPDVSLRNARRIAKLREKKLQETYAANLLKEVNEHKEVSQHLQEKVHTLHKRIVDHTTGKHELISSNVAKLKVDKLASLQESLRMVKRLAISMHDDGELVGEQWTNLVDQFKRLGHLIAVQKTAFERDANLLTN